ncbi:hypothetical protein CCP3SC15_2070003 [Gammaproteobacteria bacterium]
MDSLPYLAVAALLAWLFYSWKVAVGLALMCGAIAIFYGAVIKGEADRKVSRTFAILVLILSAVLLGVAMQRSDDDSEEPKRCNQVYCSLGAMADSLAYF